VAAADAVALPGVRPARRQGATLEVLASHAEPVVRELLARDPGLADLEVAGAGLEEAFLALTGEAESAAHPGAAALDGEAA
jgi:ABC-2 type transport system ATP-binding protein